MLTEDQKNEVMVSLLCRSEEDWRKVAVPFRMAAEQIERMSRIRTTSEMESGIKVLGGIFKDCAAAMGGLFGGKMEISGHGDASQMTMTSASGETILSGAVQVGTAKNP